MSSRRVVVVDGSNIATEGRSQPSLVQLDEAVRAYREERPDDEIIVVVDATFAHRIDDSERPMFEEAAAHNELVYPPAGAVGRGDAFLLRIAEKTNAVVLSNDSFQEFHGEHDWLFDKGRLIGGTPVPGVGWIFVARTPVRGPKSREAVKEARRTRARIGSKEASAPMPVPKAPPPVPAAATKATGKAAKAAKAAKSARKRGRKSASAAMDAAVDITDVAEVAVGAAIAEATEEAVHPDDFDGANGGGGRGRGGKRRRKRRGPPTATADLPTLNEPLTFIEFIAAHKLGSEVEGVVESFASHGAFVQIGEARCYIPLSAMGDPPPRSAREALRKGESRPFVVQALDAARRGIELALPGFEHVSGTPTEETVEAEIAEAPLLAAVKPSGRKRASATARKVATKMPAKKATSKRAATKRAASARSTGVPPAADPLPIVPEADHVVPLGTSEHVAMETTPVSSLVSDRPAKKVAAKKASAKKATAKKATTKAATKKASARKATAKKTTATKRAGGSSAKTTKAASTKKAAATRKATTPKTATTKRAATTKAASTKKPASTKPARGRSAKASKAAAGSTAKASKAATKKATAAKKTTAAKKSTAKKAGRR